MLSCVDSRIKDPVSASFGRFHSISRILRFNNRLLGAGELLGCTIDPFYNKRDNNLARSCPFSSPQFGVKMERQHSMTCNGESSTCNAFQCLVKESDLMPLSFGGLFHLRQSRSRSIR